MILTIFIAVGLYVLCIAVAFLNGLATALGRAGGESDPFSYIYLALPVILLHAFVMRQRGLPALAVSSVIVAGFYFWQATSEYGSIMANLHPDYIRIKGSVPPFDAVRWLRLRQVLPTTTIASAIVLSLTPQIRRRRKPSGIHSPNEPNVA